MLLYQVSYINGKPSYTLLPIKHKVASELMKLPTIKQAQTEEETKQFFCQECGLSFASDIRLQWHQSTHDPLKIRKSSIKQSKSINQANQEEEVQVATVKSRRRRVKTYVEEEVMAEEAPELEAEEVVVTTSKKKLNFICPSCIYSTSDRNLMINHFTNVHCYKATEVKNEPEEEYEEQQVEQEEEEEQQVEEQQEEEQQEELQEFEPVALSCANCGFTSTNQDDIDFHTCLPTEDQLYSCHLCTYECPTQMGLQSHITRKHKPKQSGQLTRKFECEECDFKCTNRSRLYTHRRKHRRGQIGAEGEERSYFCNECDFSAASKGALYLHIQRRHRTNEPKPERPEYYTCDQCDYTNKNKYEMKVHVIRKHSNEYNHECEICGKKYKIKGDLTNHIRFQHREQPIICDVCGKTCGNSNSLYVHQKFAHYKAEFECPICHRRMVSQANLDEHVLKQHEQREDAICEECGKTFTRQSRLKIHMRIHTGIKPHSCKICSKAFSRKTALRQHLLIHTGQRPYVCDICGKAFTQKPGLISHRKSHPGTHPPLPRVTIDHVLSELLTDECA